MGRRESRRSVVPLTVNSACGFLTTTGQGEERCPGEIHTALHLQLAGLLVQRVFVQIQGTGCCGGESAKENKKEGKSESSPGTQPLLRTLQELSQGLTYV